MKMNSRKNRIQAGFTLMELLLVVAILIIIGTAAAIGVPRIQRNLRQQELDDKAELVYMAAQNRLSRLRASGMQNRYAANQSGVQPLNTIPGDAEEGSLEANTLCYVSSADKGNANYAAASILPRDSVDQELWDNHWIIEYNPSSGSVYAVFYSETPMNYPTDFETLRSRQGRIRDGAQVGYYGGDSVKIDKIVTIKPSITIRNGEKLTALLRCEAPKGMNLSKFSVTLRDTEGNEDTNDYIAKKNYVTGVFEYEMTLDDLSGNGEKRFSKLYSKLTPGSDVTLTVTPVVQGDSSLVEPQSESATFNSLFAEVKGTKAYITCVRHLQNLDQGSGVGNRITAAEQKQDLYLRENGNDKSWVAVYGDKPFEPIENSDLQSYTGTYTQDGSQVRTTIYGLTITNGADLGLFKKFDGGSLTGITLSDAKLIGTGNVGALAAEVGDNTKIEDCRVYLSLGMIELTEAPRLQGACVGGLVGLAGSNVIVEDSFAATVISGATYAGGLIGSVEGGLQVIGSYADCYLRGQHTGGLVAQVTGTELPTLTNCYAAGYQTAEQSAAGLVNGEVQSLTYAYSACKCTVTGTNGTQYTTVAASIATVNNVFYLESGTSNQIGKKISYKELSDRAAFLKGNSGWETYFTAATGGGNTIAYNLRSQGLSDYSFPKLTSLPHYGDWEASFESASLVYYEKYDVTTYGFFGGNTDALRSDRIPVGDGYGMIYDTEPTSPVQIYYYNDSGEYVTATLQSNQGSHFTANDKNYYLLPLPSAAVNTTYAVTGSFYQKLTVDGKSYYYNPHFAKTVTETETAPTQTPSVISLRTARQLHWLSRDYQHLAEITESSTFRQECGIDYGSYDWSNYSNFGTVSVQNPIGSTQAEPFRATYDGGCFPIRGLSIASSGDCIGLFGYNTGALRNIVLASDYNASGTGNCSLTRSVQISGGRTQVYMGVLAGRNSGSITNCAVAGYGIPLYIYDGSSVYVGGLVGENSGTIRNSSASCPLLTVSATSATGRIGGLAGRNSGMLYSSYALGYLHAVDSKSSSLSIAGFVGENSGVIHSGYCATALTAAGTAKSYGFAGGVGSVSDCFYLSGETYYYISGLQAFDTLSNDSRTSPVSGSALMSTRPDGFGAVLSDEKYTQNHPNSNGAYPYPATVRDASGSYVHYGDWPRPSELGEAGVFYWEHEEGGSNSGYHFSFISTAGGKGSSLCTAHDDGGVITEFGYGYYSRKGITANLTMGNAFSKPGNGHNNDVEGELSKQFSDYEFQAYNTGTDNQSLYLSDDKATMKANETWTLEYGNQSYTYFLSPFFANAFSLESSTNTPGSESNQYQIRSIDQLQYINWNAKTKNATSYIDQNNYTSPAAKRFPYLVCVSGSNASTGNWNFHWQQTHDLDGGMAPGGDRYFTPIGSLYDAQGGNSNKTIAYIAYFGGVYNGGGYSIKNLEIRSKGQCIGLFGITAGAKLENIVLYSEYANEVKPLSGSVNNWYSIGGLVGFAAKGNNEASAFTNCTVSGYRIIDERPSDFDSGWGGANVGGLAGATNMDIDRCTTVTDILLKIGYQQGWKNHRTGGLVGCCRSTISNCYAGGSIVSESGTLSADISNGTSIWIGGIVGGIVMKDGGNLETLIGSLQNQPKVINSYSFVSLPKSGEQRVRGVCAIASNGEMLADFKALDYPMTMRIENCYCLAALAQNSDDYKKFCDKKSNFYNGTDLDFYAYTGTNKITPTTNRTIILKNSHSPFLTYEQMCAQIGASGGSLIEYLNEKTTSFGFVTTKDNGAPIDGKYSFPGDDRALLGQNYPFPTVLTQTDLSDTSRTVNVHYGAWPKSTLHWDQYRLSMDLFRDMDNEGEALLVAELHHPSASNNNAKDLTFDIVDGQGNPVSDEDDPAVEVVGSAIYDSNSKSYKVTLRGLSTGTAYVRASLGTDTAVAQVTVTAELNVTAAPQEAILYLGDDTEAPIITLSVASRTKDDGAFEELTDTVAWETGSQDAYVAGGRMLQDEPKMELIGTGVGDTGVIVTASREFNGKTYTGTAQVAVTVRRIGVLGIAAVQDASVSYQEIRRKDEEAPGALQPASYSDSGNAPLLVGSTLFLYAAGDNMPLGDFKLVTAKINDATVIDGTNTPDYTSYYLKLGELVVGDDFSYIPLTVNAKKELEGNVTIELTLQRGDVLYTLTIPFHIVSMPLTVQFVDADDMPLGEAVSVPYGGVIEAANLEAANLEAAHLPEPEDGYHYQLPTEEIYENATVKLSLTPNSYTVIFHDGDSMVSKSMTYDQSLPDSGFTREGHVLSGWATAPEGEVKYADRAEVTNLTDVQNGVVTLYAIWAEQVSE